MLALPEFEIDKLAAIGGCSRLPLTCDASRLRAEVEALPDSQWETRAGRLGPHDAARAIFLRGYAPAEGRDKPIEDRDVLACLPYARRLIADLVPARAQRCLLALLPPGARVPAHCDNGAYFQRNIRIHIPVATHEHVHMYSNGRLYTMRTGEVWALNNSIWHAVWNADAALPRIHLICDYSPTPELLALLGRAEHGLGRIDGEIETQLLAGSPIDPALHH